MALLRPCRGLAFDCRSCGRAEKYTHGCLVVGMTNVVPHVWRFFNGRRDVIAAEIDCPI